jgi:peptidoglycan/xylan/chitin deacetylase (PgdA/CDA1 family)
MLRLQRELAGRLYKDRAAQLRPAPIISFTFDDFPASALYEAGRLLGDLHLRGTYYASVGLMARKTVMGEMFSRSDLAALVKAGHELACHTCDHVRSCDVTGSELLVQCQANRNCVAEMLDGYKLSNFSFPEGVVNPTAKRLLGSIYHTCRTIEPGINRDPVDLGFLKANCVYAHLPIERIREAVYENSLRKGWLILYTHDVTSKPSVYGCTPGYFREVLNYAVDSGADVLTIADARKRFVPLRDLNTKLAGAADNVRI